MELYPGDIITVKKKHPCGENRWELQRVGADIRMYCMGCRRELYLKRSKVEAMIRKVEHPS